MRGMLSVSRAGLGLVLGLMLAMPIARAQVLEELPGQEQPLPAPQEPVPMPIEEADDLELPPMPPWPPVPFDLNLGVVDEADTGLVEQQPAAETAPVTSDMAQ